VTAGGVYHVGESCQLKRQFDAEGGIKKLLYYDEKNMLVTVTTNMMLTLHSVSDEGDTTETMKVAGFHFLFVAKLCFVVINKITTTVQHFNALCLANMFTVSESPS